MTGRVEPPGAPGNVGPAAASASTSPPSPTSALTKSPASAPAGAGAVPKHRRRLSRPVIVGAVVLVVVIAGLVWWYARRGNAVSYVTTPVTRGTVARGVTASGTVNPVLDVQVGTYVSGVITVLYCDYNTRVKKGQICAKIDPRLYQTAVDQAKANLANARAELVKDQSNATYDKLSYDRTVALQKQDYITQDSVDRSKNAYDQALAQIQVDSAAIAQFGAALSAAQVNLGYTDIVSPVDGTVVSRNVTMGQTVAASFQTPTLFVIAADLTKMEVDANVSESDIGGMNVGDTATFTVEAFPAKPFTGTVVQVRQSPQSVQNVITYDVVIGVANDSLLLKPGMTATCRIVTAHRDQVLRVPDQALRYTPGGLAAGPAPGAAVAPASPPPSDTTQRVSVGGTTAAPAHTLGQVFVLRDGKPVTVPVTLGLDDDSYSEVVQGGLKVGDVVIVSEGRAGSTSTAPRLPHI